MLFHIAGKHLFRLDDTFKPPLGHRKTESSVLREDAKKANTGEREKRYEEIKPHDDSYPPSCMVGVAPLPGTTSEQYVTVTGRGSINSIFFVGCRFDEALTTGTEDVLL
eukprot:scaffold7349_cov173-Amphora_coffeaeformis.AAC.57